VVKELPVLASSVSMLRCTGVELHAAHHQFPLPGERCHLQLNCYLRGVKGSGFQIRIPVSDQFRPSPKGVMNFFGGTNNFSAPMNTFTGKGISPFTLMSSYPTVWEKFSLVSKPDDPPKYRLVDKDRVRSMSVPAPPKLPTPKSK